MQKPIRLPWWGWTLVILFVALCSLLAVLLGLRAHGRAAYKVTITALEAQGKIATLNAFIDQSPKVDDELQAAWKHWEKSSINYGNNWSPKQKEWEQYLYGQAPVSEKLLSELEAERSLMDQGRLLLRDERLIINTRGWIAAEFPPHKRHDIFSVSRLHIPSLLTARCLANWLHHEACTANDPKASLGDLDRLHTAFQSPATLLESMIGLAIQKIRDQTYLELCLLNRVPASNFTTWVSESPTGLQSVANGFDGERALWMDGTVRWIEALSLFHIKEIGQFWTLSSGTTPSSWDVNWLFNGPYTWSTAHHDSAITTELYAHISARLRAERTDPIPTISALQKRYWGPSAVTIPNLIESAITALESDANHRLIRIAVRIRDQDPKSGVLIDESALLKTMGDPNLLTPSGDHLHLAYEYLAPDRFRLTVSPTSPLPDFDDPSRLPSRSKAFGTPASKNPYVNDRTSIEIQLPKRLQPVQVPP